VEKQKGIVKKVASPPQAGGVVVALFILRCVTKRPLPDQSFGWCRKTERSAHSLLHRFLLVSSPADSSGLKNPAGTDEEKSRGSRSMKEINLVQTQVKQPFFPYLQLHPKRGPQAGQARKPLAKIDHTHPHGRQMVGGLPGDTGGQDTVGNG